MNKVLIAVALAIFGLAPAIGAACEYNKESSASAAPAVQVGSAMDETPAATKVPAPKAAKPLATGEVKQVIGKVKKHVTEQKIVVNATD